MFWGLVGCVSIGKSNQMKFVSRKEIRRPVLDTKDEEVYESQLRPAAGKVAELVDVADKPRPVPFGPSSFGCTLPAGKF